LKKKTGVAQSLAVSAGLAAALFLLPLFCITPAREALFNREERVEETPPPPFVSGVADGERVLKVLDGETVTEMDLGTYLLGVLRAEMPASFPVEALKAQAVAART
jgi:stage II sporulation protein D